MIIKPRRDLIIPRRELILPRSRYCELTHHTLMGGGNAATPIPNRLIALHLNNSIVDVMGNATSAYGGTPSFVTSPAKFNTYSLGGGGAQIGANNNFILTHHSVRLWIYLSSSLSTNTEYYIWGIGGAIGSIYKPGNNSQIVIRYKTPGGTNWDTSSFPQTYLSINTWHYLEWGFTYAGAGSTYNLDLNVDGGNAKSFALGSSSSSFPVSGSNSFWLSATSGAVTVSDFEYYSVYSGVAPVPTATFPDHS